MSCVSVSDLGFFAPLHSSWIHKFVMQYIMTTQQWNSISGAPLMPSHFLNADEFGIEINVRESDDSTLGHKGTQIASSSLNYFAIFRQPASRRRTKSNFFSRP